MNFITNNRPAPLDLRSLGDSLGERYMRDHYKPAAPSAVNHKAIKPAVIPTGPALLAINTPKPSEFAGYSINATNAAAEAVKPAHAGEFFGYSINEHLKP